MFLLVRVPHGGGVVTESGGKGGCPLSLQMAWESSSCVLSAGSVGHRVAFFESFLLVMQECTFPQNLS